MIVMKFGGTSVQDEEAIRRVISIVSGRLSQHPLVVVSALSKVTRLLGEIATEAEAQHEEKVRELLRQLSERHFSLAKALLSSNPSLLDKCLKEVRKHIQGLETFVGGVCQIGELSPRSHARVISTGEILSSTIISCAFNAEGISCKWIDARRMVTTDDNYLNARPDISVTEANVKRIIGLESNGTDIILTQGFVASTAAGATSVLGFEGSDYSAAIFGMALDAERVEIWTDVDGIRTTDPRFLDGTKKIDAISYEEAAEMAAMGARVLHPLTIEPARQKNIPILVLNSKNPSCEGTVVERSDETPDGPKAVSSRNNILFIKIETQQLLGVTNILGGVMEALYSRKIPVIIAEATESEVGLIIQEEFYGLREALESISKWARVTVFRDKALISVIGRGVVTVKGLGDKVLMAAGRVYLANVSANMLSTNYVIDNEKLQDTLKVLHEYVFA
ncbi:MAG: aspartate kinase [Bacteroidales bacterium]|nr:aspartate kinase [Bacteroidales bacterium]MDY6000727.1 aspartate kinase [Candidatus Cryptobacteroides sp.]